MLCESKQGVSLLKTMNTMGNHTLTCAFGANVLTKTLNVTEVDFLSSLRLMLKDKFSLRAMKECAIISLFD